MAGYFYFFLPVLWLLFIRVHLRSSVVAFDFSPFSHYGPRYEYHRCRRRASGHYVDLEDRTVLWCTGFSPDYKFIRVHHPESAFDENGPIHRRGLCLPGLFFLGLKFQHTVGSHLLRGVGRDAEYVARKIADRTSRTVS